jgi:hypothetical protein
LADVLERERELALLFRTLATLKRDIPLFENADSLRWTGEREDFDAIGRRLDQAVTEKSPGPKPRKSIVREAGRTKKLRKT